MSQENLTFFLTNKYVTRIFQFIVLNRFIIRVDNIFVIHIFVTIIVNIFCGKTIQILKFLNQYSIYGGPNKLNMHKSSHNK